MLSIAARKLSLNPFICKSTVSIPSPSFHTLSSILCRSFVSLSTPTSESNPPSASKVVADPAVYDVLVNKHKFSPEAASFVASGLTGSKAKEKSDSILTFLEESGFSTTQLEKIAKCRPRLLTVNNDEKIRSIIKTLQEWGFSPDVITHLISSNPEILQVTVQNRIVPSLSVVKSLLESDNESMAELLRRCPWLVTTDLEKTLSPNVELLKSCGIAMADIRRFLFVRAMFVRAPQVLTTSTKKLKKLKSLLVSTGKLDSSTIVAHSGAVGCSIEKKLKPKLRILGILESKGLIEKWPSFGTIYTITDDKFLDRFVWPYSDKVGKAFDNISYIYGEQS